MGKEIAIYALIVVACMAMAWVFSGRGEDRSLGHSNDPTWKHLPSIFKLTWGFALVFEKSVGASLVGIFKAKAKKFNEQAVIAALPLTAEKVYAAAFALALICALVGLAFGIWVYFAFPKAWVGFAVMPVFVCGLIGWFWPSQNLAAYAKERQEQLTHELPFAIDLIGAAMRAGVDFGAAMRYFVANGDKEGPLVEEFSQVLNDTTLGRPFEKSLEDMANRVKLNAFTSFVGVVAYGAEIGAPIAKTLKMHGEDLRRQRFHMAENKAAKAPSIMIFPLVLFLMPSVFIVILTPMVMRIGKMFIH